MAGWSGASATTTVDTVDHQWLATALNSTQPASANAKETRRVKTTSLTPVTTYICYKYINKAPQKSFLFKAEIRYACMYDRCSYDTVVGPGPKQVLVQNRADDKKNLNYSSAS